MPWGEEVVYRSREDRPLLEKIQRAVGHYNKRNVRPPNYCLIHRLTWGALTEEEQREIQSTLGGFGIMGITVDVMPLHCIVLGHAWEEKKDEPDSV